MKHRVLLSQTERESTVRQSSENISVAAPSGPKWPIQLNGWVGSVLSIKLKLST